MTNSIDLPTTNILAEDSTAIARDNIDFNKLENTSIVTKFNQLKQIFLNNDTAETFSKSFHLLFVLIKESMILIWLLLCWSIVALSWVSDRTKQIYQGVLGWWNTLHAAEQYSSKVDIATETVQNGIQKLVAKAKKQVGLSEFQ
jgi:hypothetical protein